MRPPHGRPGLGRSVSAVLARQLFPTFKPDPRPIGSRAADTCSNSILFSVVFRRHSVHALGDRWAVHKHVLPYPFLSPLLKVLRLPRSCPCSTISLLWQTFPIAQARTRRHIFHTIIPMFQIGPQRKSSQSSAQKRIQRTVGNAHTLEPYSSWIHVSTSVLSAPSSQSPMLWAQGILSCHFPIEALEVAHKRRQ